MEQKTDEIAVSGQGNWNLSKVLRAKRLLEKGHSPAQVGSKLQLSQAQIAELEMDSEDIEPKPELETHQEWRKRKSETIERHLVTISENHLAGVMEMAPGMLDPETAGTVKDISAIAHKWLRNGEEATKSITVNFSALAQVKAPHLSDGTKQVYDVESQTVDSPEDANLSNADEQSA